MSRMIENRERGNKLIEIDKYIILFFAFSFLGWLMEVMMVILKERKIVNRGFLIGPCCPIYGFGGLIMTLLLQNIKNNPILLFLLSLLICSVLEYGTSYVMEKLFHARWWDYSNRKFNINGRICLTNMIAFGLLGCLIIYILDPIYFEKIKYLSTQILNIICIILLALFLIDSIFSVKIIKNIKLIKKNMKDNTEEITRRVKEILIEKSALTRRIVEAFPNMMVIKEKIKRISKQDLKFKNK